MPDASRGLDGLLPGLLLLMACAALPSTDAATSRPQVVLARETLYYDVGGASASELRAQLDLHSEIEQDAYTDWQIQWRYDYIQGYDGCGLTSLTVNLDVTLTFPRWTPPEGAVPGLQEQWRVYLAALEAHEQGHEKLAAQAADEIVTALSSLSLYPSCTKLERAADEAGERILEHYRQLELEYDRETEHGATQGARFP